MMFLVDFRLLRRASRRDLYTGHAAGRRRLLRRPDRGAGRGLVVHAQDPPAAAEDGRRVRARPSRWATASAAWAAFPPAAAGACECHLPWAVTFTNPVANELVGVPLGIPLHPTQLYESFAEFAIFGVALLAHSPAAPPAPSSACT